MQQKKNDRATYHPRDFLCGEHKHEKRWRHNSTQGFCTDSFSLDNLFFNSYQTELCGASGDMFLAEWERDSFMIEYVFHDQRNYHAKGSKHLRVY